MGRDGLPKARGSPLRGACDLWAHRALYGVRGAETAPRRSPRRLHQAMDRPTPRRVQEIRCSQKPVYMPLDMQCVCMSHYIYIQHYK